MKEKMKRFSNGDFEYERPFLILSEEEIRITVEAGRVYEGSFSIGNSSNREMEGKIYSTNRLLKVKNNAFHAPEETTVYSFDASFLKAGEVIYGELIIVSDCGEKSIRFQVQVEAPYVMTSMGKIKDLFQFANLARMDWSEAKKVFRSRDFERVFLAEEKHFLYIYRDLLKSISTSQALEEFLVVIHKKAMIRLEIDKVKVEYKAAEEEIGDRLILTKNHWGYIEIRVSTDAAFIRLEQKLLWADCFIGDTHIISYIIDPKKMRPGNNFGNILIKTAYQVITVEVKCKLKKKAESPPRERILHRTEFGLMSNYLDFRLNRHDLEHYIGEAENMLKKLKGSEDRWVRQLIKIHLAIISGNKYGVRELFGEMEKENQEVRHRPVLEYCAYLYLKALYDKKEDSIRTAAETIRFYYESESHDWRLLWFLLNTDTRYEKNAGYKLREIREQFMSGCHSPILYYEAVCIYNEEPVLLRELKEFEIQALNYGIRNFILTKELMRQYTYLAGKSKDFHPIVFHNLTKLYERYHNTDILSVICSILIKGLKKSEKYFKWYQLGVAAQLRITELYEYYMHSVSISYVDALDQSVLMYFIYNSSLSDRKKAFLYANIIQNKERNEAIYRSYYRFMEAFTVKLLEAHQINKDLAVLYKEFMDQLLFNSETGKHLPYVMFRHELSCENQNIVSVMVLHKEIEEQENINLSEGKAQINLFTDTAEIILIDHLGNRYIKSIEYTLTPYFKEEEIENLSLEYSKNTMLMLHFYNRCQNYRIMNESSIKLRREILEQGVMTKEYEAECCRTLIEYYYENYNDELLEYYLMKLDYQVLKMDDRIKFIEYTVTRLLYEKAFSLLEIYGFEGVAVNRLLKMCSGWLSFGQGEKRRGLVVDLCHYVFMNEKYDEAVLRYLVVCFEGSTKEMYLLWRAAKRFDLETHKLEERLLTQILFSECYLEESCRVFRQYYQSIHNHILVRAFLTYYAYKYLVHLQVIHSELFPIMKRELTYEENEICMLAWLRQHADRKILTTEEATFIEYHINRFVKKNMILPFFTEYRNKITLPERLQNRSYITYITNPEKQVYLHYRLMKRENQDYITEHMNNVFMGIHVKEFVLFYQEELQYYITEETAGGVNITESFYTRYDCKAPDEKEGKYHYINLMLMALEMKDDNTLLELMENYIVLEGMADICFGQIDQSAYAHRRD